MANFSAIEKNICFWSAPMTLAPSLSLFNFTQSQRSHTSNSRLVKVFAKDFCLCRNLIRYKFWLICHLIAPLIHSLGECAADIYMCTMLRFVNCRRCRCCYLSLLFGSSSSNKKLIYMSGIYIKWTQIKWSSVHLHHFLFPLIPSFFPIKFNESHLSIA